MSSKKTATVLLIDDDEDILMSLSLYLKLHFQKVLTTRVPAQINQLFSQYDIDLVLLDMNFRTGVNDGREGLYWLSHIKEMKPEVAVILLTAYGSIPLAVESLQRGAHDFLIKPWKNSQLLASVHMALEKGKSLRKKEKSEAAVSPRASHPQEKHLLRPASQAMKNIQAMADKVALTEANILILGENGTGKEVMARYIHEHSGRSAQAFVALDLGGVSESLFEAELFGYKKGAFTDAKEDKPGRFELARGGTLFLDEIGNIPLALQAKLLTAIQNRTIYPVGSTEKIKVDCRIICATNVNLNEAVREGGFRQDLMFRINTIELELPPLRERREDIPTLTRYFLNLFNAHYNKRLSFSEDAIATLAAYPWPGNVRELQHVVERSVILADNNLITAKNLHLPDPSGAATTEESEMVSLDEIEKRHISRMLHRFEGNISKTAKALNINRNTLYRKIEKYGL